MELIEKILFSTALALFLSANVFASSLPDFPFIGVKGVAETEVTPDIATISFGFLEFNESSAEEALEVIKLKSDKVIELAREMGVPDKAITSTGIDNEIVREVNRDRGYNRTNILGYEISQGFIIEIKDLSIYSEFVDKLISVGNVDRIRPTFDISNRKEVLRELVQEAGKDARNNADDLANAMDVKIKSVYAINQDSSFESFFASFGLQEVAPSSDIMTMSMSAPVGSDSVNIMVPKSIKLTKTIGVVYKIR